MVSTEAPTDFRRTFWRVRKYVDDREQDAEAESRKDENVFLRRVFSGILCKVHLSNAIIATFFGGVQPVICRLLLFSRPPPSGCPAPTARLCAAAMNQNEDASLSSEGGRRFRGRGTAAEGFPPNPSGEPPPFLRDGGEKSTLCDISPLVERLHSHPRRCVTL